MPTYKADSKFKETRRRLLDKQAKYIPVDQIKIKLADHITLELLYLTVDYLKVEIMIMTVLSTVPGGCQRILG